MSKKNSGKREKQKLDKEIEEELREYRPHTQGNILNEIRIDLKCKNENQKKLVNLIKDKEIVICAGVAGVGKTFISCAEALKLLKQNMGYEKIVLIKSVVSLKNEELGFIKGTVEDKLQGVMYSFMYNFEKIIGKYNTEKLKEFNIIEAIPIAFMRGLSIDNSVILIDEVQNISIDNMRTILTRIGTNSKMILLGDLNQMDIKNKEESCLRFLLDNFKSIDEIGTIELGIEDVVRNPLIKKIEPIFTNHKK